MSGEVGVTPAIRIHTSTGRHDQPAVERDGIIEHILLLRYFSPNFGIAKK
jgi:hypothetical protein